jgi:hypothetical protein
MNLLGVVAGVIGTVNPLTPITLNRSSGYTTQADGVRTPAYDVFNGRVQILALSGSDLKQVSGLNIQGVMRAAYLKGDWQGSVRAGQKGGDTVVWDGSNWLVVHVLETWPDWCKVVLCLQL